MPPILDLFWTRHVECEKVYRSLISENRYFTKTRRPGESRHTAHAVEKVEMNKKNTAPDDWRPCPQGAFSLFASRERTRRRCVLLTKAAGFSSILLLVVGVGYFAFGLFHSGGPTFGGVTCTTVRSNARQYLAGKLDAHFSEQIRIHLEQCPDCQRFWKEMAGKAMGQASLSAPLRSSENCDCEGCRRNMFAVTDVGDVLVVPSRLAETKLALAR